MYKIRFVQCIILLSALSLLIFGNAISQDIQVSESGISQEEVDEFYNKLMAFNALKNETVSNNNLPILKKSEIAKLKPEVKALYEKAIFYFDRVNQDSALECLKTAVLIQPEIIAFHSTIASIYVQKARLSMGDKSIEYYTYAEKTIDNILSQPDLKETELENAQSMLKDIKKEKENIPVRDDRRKALSDKIVQQQYIDLYGEERYKRQLEKVQNKQTELNTTLPGTFSSATSIFPSTEQPSQQTGIQPIPPMTDQVAPQATTETTASPFSEQGSQTPSAASPFSQTDTQPQAPPAQPVGSETQQPATPPAEQASQSPFSNQ